MIKCWQNIIIDQGAYEFWKNRIDKNKFLEQMKSRTNENEFDKLKKEIEQEQKQEQEQQKNETIKKRKKTKQPPKNQMSLF